MANDLTYLQMDICASLWLKPCSIKELSVRLDKSEYGIFLLYRILIDKKWIYKRGDTLFCYKKTVLKTLNPNGYELDLKESHFSEFRKEYLRSLQ